MIGLFRQWFLGGLVALLPLALTIWLLWWVSNAADSLIAPLLERWLPQWQLPGMGLLAALLLVLGAGILMRLWLLQRLWQCGESILSHLPVVKVIYKPLKDMMSFFAQAGGSKGQLNRVVMVRLGEARMIGFLTRDDPFIQRFAKQPDPAGEISESADGGKVGDEGEQAHHARLVAVYIPMSYQLGGYTLLIPQDRLEACNLTVEEAMRFALTAGLASTNADDATSQSSRSDA